MNDHSYRIYLIDGYVQFELAYVSLENRNHNYAVVFMYMEAVIKAY